MKISKDSWHYKIVTCWDHWDTPETTIGYWSQFICSPVIYAVTLACLIVAIIVLPVILPITYAWDKIESSDKFYNFKRKFIGRVEVINSSSDEE